MSGRPARPGASESDDATGEEADRDPIPWVRGPAEAGLQRRASRRRSIAALVVGVVLVVVAAGGAGSGPISWATATDGELRVSYERVARRGSSWSLQVEAPAPSGGALAVTLNRSLLDGQKVDSVNPQPDAVVATPDGRTYRFATGGDGRVTTEFRLRPDVVGPQRGDVAVGGTGRVVFRQFALP